jgi:hypothetical protein
MNHRSQNQPRRSPEQFRAALNQRLHRDDGLRCALVAINCYRHRRDITDRARTVGTARAYVSYARRAGFRGSVNAILDELAAGGAR